MSWRQILRDFLRGYTDADLDTLTVKLENAGKLPPGGLVEVTNSELAAVGEYMRRKHILALLAR